MTLKTNLLWSSFLFDSTFSAIVKEEVQIPVYVMDHGPCRGMDATYVFGTNPLIRVIMFLFWLFALGIHYVFTHTFQMFIFILQQQQLVIYGSKNKQHNGRRWVHTSQSKQTTELVLALL